MIDRSSLQHFRRQNYPSCFAKSQVSRDIKSARERAIIFSVFSSYFYRQSLFYDLQYLFREISPFPSDFRHIITGLSRRNHEFGTLCKNRGITYKDSSSGSESSSSSVSGSSSTITHPPRITRPSPEAFSTTSSGVSDSSEADSSTSG